jgi:hypothetical protein
MIAEPWLHISTAISLLIVMGTLIVAIIVSSLAKKPIEH